MAGSSLTASPTFLSLSPRPRNYLCHAHEPPASLFISAAPEMLKSRHAFFAAAAAPPECCVCVSVKGVCGQDLGENWSIPPTNRRAVSCSIMMGFFPPLSIWQSVHSQVFEQELVLWNKVLVAYTLPGGVFLTLIPRHQ